MASYGAEIARQGSRLNLSRLSEVSRTSALMIEDIRGHKVIDINGESIGHIVDVLIDEIGLEIRFFIVEPAEPLSLTHTSLLIPVDALKEGGNGVIFIDCPCEHVAGSPRCYPDMIDSFYIEEVYGYYGYAHCI